MSDASDLRLHEEFFRGALMIDDEKILRPLMAAQLADSMFPGSHVFMNPVGEFAFYSEWHSA